MFKSVILVFYYLVATGFCIYDKSYHEGKSVLVGVSYVVQCTKHFSCLDCSTARICKPDGKGAFQQVTTIPCPVATPFCNQISGTCGVTPDATCGAPDTTFVCMDDGYFPDPNCADYHVCSGFTASKYHCSIAGEKYDAEQKKCSATAPCGTFKCVRAGEKVVHSNYPQYFGYCSAAGLPPTVIDKCKGTYEMNVTSQLCEPLCRKEGVQQDVDDCTKYFRCHKEMLPTGDQGSWVSVMMKDHLDCPANTAFEPTQFICVDIKLTKCVPKTKV